MSEALQSILGEVIQSLAEFFGTTTQAILEQLPSFLAKYGWYTTIRGLWQPCLIAIAIGLGVHIVADLEASDHSSLWSIIMGIVTLIIGVSIMLGACAVAPEIAGAHALIEVLRATGN